MKAVKAVILLALLVGLGAVVYHYAANRAAAPSARPTGQVSDEANDSSGQRPRGRKLELQEKYGFAPLPQD
jgi:hypothetical protein